MARTHKVTKEQIETLYWSEGLSLRKVAKKLSIAVDTLVSYMHSLNIRTRNLSESHRGLSSPMRGIKTNRVPKSAWKRGNIPWNKGKKCEYLLGNQFSAGRVPWNKELNKFNYSLYEEMSKQRRGSRHWLWKGGITSDRERVYSSREYKIWRQNVFERDCYTCQGCGSVGGHLRAHHNFRFSDYPELRFDISNGITLCKKCHCNLGSIHTTPINHKEEVRINVKVK